MSITRFDQEIKPEDEHLIKERREQAKKFWEQQFKGDMRAALEDDKEPKKETSCIYGKDFLAEQVYSSDTGFEFLLFHFVDKRQERAKEIQKDGQRFVPINATEEVLYGAVKLPRGTRPYVSLENLIDSVRAHIQKYLDVSPFYQELAVYYILTSWLFDGLYAVPYLRALGDTGTGKSRFLDVIGGLCYKTIMASGCITPAPIYRLIRKWGGTLVIDESDFGRSDEQSEIVKILNCGIEKGRPIVRCDSNNAEKLNIFPAFCPKVFATRRTFDDKALESRCLTEVMTETSRRDIPDQLPKAFHEEQAELRDMLLQFRFDNFQSIDVEAIQKVEMKHIEPRLRQVARSLMVFMLDKPAILDKFQMFIQQHNRELIQERATSVEGWIVNSLFELNKNVGDITPSDIANAVNLEYSPKVSMTAPKVGRYLKSLKVTVELRRGADGKTGRFVKWDTERMETLKRRYVTDVTDVTEPIGGPEVAVTNSSSPHILPLQPLQVLQKKFGNGPFHKDWFISRGYTIESISKAAESGQLFQTGPDMWGFP